MFQKNLEKVWNFNQVSIQELHKFLHNMKKIQIRTNKASLPALQAFSI